MDAARRAFAFVKKHPRIFIAVQAVILAIFLGSIGWALRGSFKDARPTISETPTAALHASRCVVLAAYYPRLRVRLDAHPRRLDLHISYPGRAARRDGLDAREVRAGGRVDTGSPRRRRAARRHHGRRARDRLDPRRGGNLRRRRRGRLRRLAPMGGRG